MRLEYSFPEELEKAKRERWPFIIPVGVIEYHGRHIVSGCDTFLTMRPLEMLEKEKNIVLAPPFWYGPASWAVAGPDKACSINVDYDAFEKLFYNIFSSLLDGGWRNIYVFYFHQSEALNPMGASLIKAARVALFDFLQREHGYGWWGDERNAHFYEGLKEEDKENPWNWITVETIADKDIIRDFGFDHAGKYETSFLKYVMPEAVELSRCKENHEWFAIKNESEVDEKIGKEMTERVLERLRKIVR